MGSKKTTADEHIDWSRLGSKSRKQIDEEAAREKSRLGLVGRRDRVVAVVNGKRYATQPPDVRSIRAKLALTQEAFAKRFHLSLRTVQQWEQRRTNPDVPTRILLKAIEQSPKVKESVSD